ncbi:MAG TPA: hypothetical protein PKI05_09445 [Thermogutta sp.]|nr:hypothetical protein [Thermogutta sp.]
MPSIDQELGATKTGGFWHRQGHAAPQQSESGWEAVPSEHEVPQQDEVHESEGASTAPGEQISHRPVNAHVQREVELNSQITAASSAQGIPSLFSMKAYPMA